MGTVVLITLLLYISGVCMARLQLTEWKNKGVVSENVDICTYSLLSWAIYVVYAFVRIYEWFKNK